VASAGAAGGKEEEEEVDTRPPNPIQPAVLRSIRKPPELERLIAESRAAAARAEAERRRARTDRTGSPSATVAATPDSGTGQPLGSVPAPGATLSIRSAATSGKIGKPLSVQIHGEGVANLGTATLAIRFDAKRFKLQSVEPGGLLGPKADLTHTVEQDTLKISFHPQAETPLQPTGELVKVKWIPLLEGKSDLTILPAETLLLDRTQAVLTWQGKTAQLSVVR